MDIKYEIENGLCSLGIEFGSTRIKAVLISSDKSIAASGGYDWENKLVDGVWTYDLDEVVKGLQSAYSTLKSDVFEKHGITLRKIKAIGISAMMHGYIALDKDMKLLTPFRTWRNTITEEESITLMSLFSFPIAQRWTICHLLKDVKKKCSYLDKVDYVSTLSSYVHRILTGKRAVSIGDASGMFPFDSIKKDYDDRSIKLFDEAYLEDYSWSLRDVFPKVYVAGEVAGELTEVGALLLDPEGDLSSGIPFCAPEGDAGTGMVATNSVRARTGNVSAGTSAFAMVVLERPLKKVHPELDLVTTPDGSPVAMAHSNNCTGAYDGWLRLFGEAVAALGFDVPKHRLYDTILELALKGDPDCGGLVSYGYLSGEHVTGLSEGRPLFVRNPDSNFNLPNFIRSELYTSLCAMRTGLDILFNEENAEIDVLSGHGGFFKAQEVGLKMLSAATGSKVRALSTAGEGGAWGVALLADFLSYNEMSLPDYLDKIVFSLSSERVIEIDERDTEGFNKYYRRYHELLDIERKAVELNV